MKWLVRDLLIYLVYVCENYNLDEITIKGKQTKIHFESFFMLCHGTFLVAGGTDKPVWAILVVPVSSLPMIFITRGGRYKVTSVSDNERFNKSIFLFDEKFHQKVTGRLNVIA